MSRVPGRTTLGGIAAEAGVSLATVSKVINGRPDVSPATRRRIEQLLLERRYVPVGARRGPAGTLVDVVFPTLDSPWAVEILRGVSETTAEYGVHTTVSTAPRDDDASWPHRLVAAGRAGVVVVAAALGDHRFEELAGSGVPLVVVDPPQLPRRDLASVGATNWAGGRVATQHLIALGHRRIATITGRPALLCSRARLDGYRSALEEAGLPFDASLVREGTFRHDAGFTQAGVLLDLPDPPTAVVAGSDQQAFGVIEAARVRGLRVPEDVSVVGFDDLPVARWASPPLTTVRQPLADMGRMAARIVMQQARGEDAVTTQVELSTELIVRHSTAPPRP
ncbi:MAG: LacI family DNA-binding transcriptional regulator [Kineosporiaceae bacterium]